MANRFPIQAINECRSCGMRAQKEAVKVSCQFCNIKFSSGKSQYSCDFCERDWLGGKSNSLTWKGNAVCEKCGTEEAGSCVICDKIVCLSNAHNFESETVCSDCFNKKQEIVWCPKCERSFPNKGFLNFIFRNDSAVLHAAALVTHYRHTHVKSYDRACRNPSYAAKIPHYNYVDYKAKVNNCAKRQIIRAIVKHVEKNSYPETAPISARGLILGFGVLKENDEATKRLIEKHLAN